MTSIGYYKASYDSNNAEKGDVLDLYTNEPPPVPPKSEEAPFQFAHHIPKLAFQKKKLSKWDGFVLWFNMYR